MKITIISKASVMNVICLSLLLNCTERTGGPGSRETGKDTAATVAGQEQIARWVDYVNYKVSRHALLKDNLRLGKFDAVTINDKRYDSILSALTAIRSDKDSVSQNEVLAKEINTLKPVLSLKKTVNIAAYFSDSIFKDSVKYRSIHSFYQKRVKTADSITLFKLQSELQSALEDSIKSAGIIAASTEPTAINTAPRSNEKKPEDELSPIPIVLVCVAIVLIALVIVSLLKNRKKNKPAPVAQASTEEKNTQLGTDNHKTENEKLWRKVKEQELLIAKLEEDLLLLKNKSSQEKIVPPLNTANTMYFPAPNNNSFPISAGTNTKRSFDAYQLEINGNTAFFNLLTDDSEVVKRALNSPDIYLLQVSEIESSSANYGRATNIKVVEKGELQKAGDQWILKKKSLIKLL